MRPATRRDLAHPDSAVRLRMAYFQSWKRPTAGPTHLRVATVGLPPTDPRALAPVLHSDDTGAPLAVYEAPDGMLVGQVLGGPVCLLNWWWRDE